MWKYVYHDYFKAYIDTPFFKETLKDHLWETLKELKTSYSNKEG